MAHKHGNVAIFVPHNGCPNMCSFCNQRTISGQSEQPDADFVRNACGKACGELTVGAENAQIAFFGGSFTAIDRELMVSLLDAAAGFVEKGFFSGIRISTRPDCVDEEVLDILAKRHVESIELGAQSMDDRILTMNLRGHTVKDVEDASRRIKARGFSLGLQMMAGLYGENPGDTPDDARPLREHVMLTARRIAELEPDEVRIYPVAVLKGTGLERLWREGRYFPPELQEAVECCADAMLLFREKSIKLLRVGLHASEALQAETVAGIYHPAFRELCESEIYFRRMRLLLEQSGKKRGTFVVAPQELSKALGQRRENVTRLAQLGFDVRITAAAGTRAGEAVLLPEVK